MNTCAGGALYHRNLTHEPMMAAHRTAISDEPGTSGKLMLSDHSVLPTTQEINRNTAVTIIMQPAASPSMPSVRFTALDDATIVTTVMTMYARSPSFMGSFINGT